ncbi:MAG: SGNH/GDSL hydrolase family protein [Thermoleophilaceae bacterium]|nr:SGNH/GDSL hydrolase family protein [Thermoleophilaceae bacterium]
MAALGDSITAGSPKWDPDEGVRNRLGAALDPESQFEYWAQLRLGDEVTFRNCGVFGERTDEIAARQDACAKGARYLVIQGGINDIAQGRPAADAARSIRGMVIRGKEAGLRVGLVDVLPWNNGHPRADRPIAELNRAIHAIGREERVPVLDFHDALEDPRAEGTMSARYTDDGDHPSVAGYRRLGTIFRLP